MPGRFPEHIPQGLDDGSWTKSLGHKVKRWMETIEAAMGGLQGTPGDVSEIQAGVTGATGESQAPSPSDHIHAIETAAPGYALLNTTPAEGTGTALMRADAVLVVTDEVEVLDWIEL